MSNSDFIQNDLLPYAYDGHNRAASTAVGNLISHESATRMAAYMDIIEFIEHNKAKWQQSEAPKDKPNDGWVEHQGYNMPDKVMGIGTIEVSFGNDIPLAKVNPWWVNWGPDEKGNPRVEKYRIITPEGSKTKEQLDKSGRDHDWSDLKPTPKAKIEALLCGYYQVPTGPITYLRIADMLIPIMRKIDELIERENERGE